MSGVANQASIKQVGIEPNFLLRLWRNKDTRSVILQILTMALLFAFLEKVTRRAGFPVRRVLFPKRYTL